MTYAPTNIKPYCFADEKTGLLSDFADDEYSFVYNLRCTCGCKYLGLFANDTPKVTACCRRCGNGFDIYDLRLYPTSAPDADSFLSSLWLDGYDETAPLTVPFSCTVYVNYQYGDSINDPDFDENCVTGFNMWIYDKGEMKLVIEDETA